MSNSKTPPENTIALIVDIDGSLLRTDMLFECFWAALGRHPVQCLIVLWKHLFDRALLKQQLAGLAELDVDLLPVRPVIVEMIARAKRDRREVILASGSDQTLVSAMAARVGGIGTIASDGVVNLTSHTKARVLVERFGVQGFDYVGDSRADIPVWKATRKIIIVAPGARLAKTVSQLEKPVETVGDQKSMRHLARALRPHQWIKNILLLLPIVAAHSVGWANLSMVLLAIVVFSAAASSIYIVNDLLDLSADRRHPTKRRRPFAAGDVSIQAGMLASVVLGSAALVGAGLISWSFLAIIVIYMMLSLAYSLVLKRLRWVDVSTLAALYTLRVVAGAVAGGVAMTGWLAVFIFPVFLALGCVKRLVELGKAQGEAPLPGRGYARRDRGDLRNIAVTAAVAALVVFGLYTFSEIAGLLYGKLWLLRLSGVAVALWLARMVMRGWQGRMDYDPIVFALRDPVGVGLMGIGAALILRAAEII